MAITRVEIASSIGRPVLTLFTIVTLMRPIDGGCFAKTGLVKSDGLGGGRSNIEDERGKNNPIVESCGNEIAMVPSDLGGRTRGGGNVLRERVCSVDG